MNTRNRHHHGEHPAYHLYWNIQQWERMWQICVDMEQSNPEGEVMAIKKPTRWMSNSPLISHNLSRRSEKNHDHLHLRGGRARQAQVYPQELCTAILEGLKRQLTIDGIISTKFVGSIEPEEESCEELVSEYADELWGEFYDVSGKALRRER